MLSYLKNLSLGWAENFRMGYP